MLQALVRLWRGELTLKRAFWEFAIVYGSIANLAATIAAFAVLAAGGPAALAIVIFLLPAPYNLAAAVGVWRSAATYAGPAIWANAARAAVLVWAIVATLA